MIENVIVSIECDEKWCGSITGRCPYYGETVRLQEPCCFLFGLVSSPIVLKRDIQNKRNLRCEQCLKALTQKKVEDAVCTNISETIKNITTNPSFKKY
jgi:hypothetical protein